MLHESALPDELDKLALHEESEDVAAVAQATAQRSAEPDRPGSPAQGGRIPSPEQTTTTQ